MHYPYADKSKNECGDRVHMHLIQCNKDKNTPRFLWSPCLLSPHGKSCMETNIPCDGFGGHAVYM